MAGFEATEKMFGVRRGTVTIEPSAFEAFAQGVPQASRSY